MTPAVIHKNAVYCPDIVERVRELARAGLTNHEISKELVITSTTLYRWRALYPEFRDAIAEGRDNVDYRVERTYLERALGFKWVERRYVSLKQADGSEEVVELEEEKMLPPDPKALAHWLSVRRPTEWTDARPDKTVTISITHEQALKQLLGPEAAPAAGTPPEAPASDVTGFEDLLRETLSTEAPAAEDPPANPLASPPDDAGGGI